MNLKTHSSLYFLFAAFICLGFYSCSNTETESTEVVNQNSDIPQESLTDSILSRPRKSIQDYFLLLPEQVEIDAPVRELSQKEIQDLINSIRHKNLKNGYLETEKGQLALFTFEKKKYLVSSQNVADSNLSFRAFKLDSAGRKWNRVWNIFPDFYRLSNGIQMNLPEIGTTITFDSFPGFDPSLVRLEWERGKFRPKLNSLPKHGSLFEHFRALRLLSFFPLNPQQTLLNQDSTKIRISYSREGDIDYSYLICLFSNDESDLVAVVHSIDCPTEMCNDDFYFYTWDNPNEGFKDVSEKVFPLKLLENKFEQTRYAVPSDSILVNHLGFSLALIDPINNSITLDFTAFTKLPVETQYNNKATFRRKMVWNGNQFSFVD